MLLVSIIVLISLFTALTAFAAAGDLDTSFNSPDGYAILDLGYTSFANEVAIQEDGKIVVVEHRAGSTYIYDILVARFLVAITETATIASDDYDNLSDLSIYNHGSSSCDFTVTKYPVPPGGMPADPGEMPMQWDVASTCSTIYVDLDFRYTEDELYYGNNVTEANLVAFKNTGGDTWTNQCGTYSCEQYVDDNIFIIYNVTSLSSWTIGDPTSSGNTAPTSVEVKSVRGSASTQPGMVVALVGISGGILSLVYRKRRS